MSESCFWQQYSRSLRGFGFMSFCVILISANGTAQSIPSTAQDTSQITDQSGLPAAVSPRDPSVLTPEPTTTLGVADATAATELTAYSSMLGGGTPWTGMQGTGTITYAAGSAQYSVTLSNIGTDRFRLDTQLTTGVESLRIHGRVGKIQAADGGSVLSIDPDTAILGVFPFEITEKANGAGKNTALLDRGLVSISGQSLHRVSLELPSTLRDAATKSQKILPVDLYFDPTTHLLVKSVGYVLMSEGRRVPFLSVVTYSDYRAVGASLVPFHYSETLNGHPYRTLQLQSAQLNPTLPATYFQF